VKLPTRNVRWLLVRPGKTTPRQLRRRNLTDEQFQADEKMREDCAFYKFVAALSGERFKKRRSDIQGKIAAEDLMLKVSRGLRTIIDGDAAALICQAVSQRDQAFFKAFCKTLAGQKFNHGGLDNYNLAILRLIYDGDTKSGREKLNKDFPLMVDNFREYRKRWLDMLPAKYRLLDHRKKQRKNKRNKTVKLKLRRRS
jgi:hypothetical protein